MESEVGDTMSRRQEVIFVMVERTVEPTILRNFGDVEGVTLVRLWFAMACAKARPDLGQ